MKGLRWIAPVLTAIPLATLFGPALVADRSLAMRDSAHFYYPLFQWCSQEWVAGRVPLWNPNENCGTPMLADATSGVFYPGKLLFFTHLDYAVQFKLFVIGHVVLAATGSYLLARMWNASHTAAAVAAMAYACGGQVAFQYCNVPFLIGAAWLPLAALFADRAVRAASWRAMLLLGAVLALMILGGDPQMAYHVLLACGLCAVLLALRRNAHVVRDIDDWQERWMARGLSFIFDGRMHRGLVVRVALIALAGMLAVLLAAVQVWPSAEATPYSERAAFDRPRNIYEAVLVVIQPANAVRRLDESKWASIGRGLFGLTEPGLHQEFVYDFSVGPWRLAEYVWPNVSGRMFPTHRRWLSILPAEGRIWTPTLYLGLLPVLFGLCALRLSVGNMRQRWLSWMVVLFTVASFGVYGVGWALQEVNGWLPRGWHSELGVGLPVGGLYWLMVVLLPYYVLFRYPAKVLPLVALGLSQLAAIGWDQAATRRRRRLVLLLAMLGVGSAVFAVAVACVDPGLIAYQIPADPAFGPFDGVRAQRDVFLSFGQTAVVSLVALLLLRRVWANPASKEWWKTALLMLTAVELAIANSWLVVTAPGEVWRKESPVATAIEADRKMREGDAAARVFRGNLAGWRPVHFAKEMSEERLTELTQWERETLYPKFHLADDVALVESSNSMKLVEYESLLRIAKRHGPRQADKSHLPQPTALRLLGTQYLVLPDAQQPEFAERVKSDAAWDWPEDAVLWRMKETLPRAWIVHQVESIKPLPATARMAQIEERTKEVLFPNGKPRDFARTAVVETVLPLEWNDKDGHSAASNGEEACRITTDESQRVVVEANVKSPGLLVLADAWFPGWKAFVSTGTGPCEVPIHRTNRVLRGVWLEAGSNQVEFRYEPESFRRGAVISGISWPVLVVLGLIAFLTQRREGGKGAKGKLD